MKKYHKFFLSTIIVLVLLSIFTKQVKCQNMSYMIRSNPADLTDPRSVIVNPATISFHAPQLALGVKIWHLGFLENDTYGLRHQFGSVSYPGIKRVNLGVGITGQAFNGPGISLTNFSFAVSQIFIDRLSIGSKVNVFSMAINPDPGSLEQDFDPILQQGSKTSVSFGLGLYIMLLHNLNFGVSMDHINEPSISFVDDDVRQRITTDVGFKYEYKNFAFSTCINYDGNEDKMFPGYAVEAFLFERARLKLGYGKENEAFKIETQFSLDKGISFNYHVDYPSNDLSKASHGSHEMGLIYNLDWVVRSGFNVQSEISTLEIFRKSNTIVVDADVTDEELGKVTEADLNPSFEDQLAYNEKMSQLMNEVMPDSSGTTNLTPLYRQSIDQISRQLTNRKDLQVEIVVPEGTEDRALTIKNRITRDWNISEERIKIVVPQKTQVQQSNNNVTKSTQLDDIIERKRVMMGEPLVINQNYIDGISHQETVFNIKSKLMTRPIKSWHLIIQDRNGNPVKSFSGYRVIHKEIRWNWTDEKGDFIKPGAYYYFLKWQNANDQYQYSDKKLLNVIKRNHNVTINLTKKSLETELKQKNKKVVKYQLQLRDN